jgi:hypothetical protein
LRLLTTWPCIAEASYLLDAPQRYEMLHWIELGGALVYPFESYLLGDMIKWMRQYAKKTKREMDPADASLYWLAIETGVTSILTIDAADFPRYRLPGRTKVRSAGMRGEIGDPYATSLILQRLQFTFAPPQLRIETNSAPAARSSPGPSSVGASQELAPVARPLAGARLAAARV